MISYYSWLLFALCMGRIRYHPKSEEVEIFKICKWTRVVALLLLISLFLAMFIGLKGKGCSKGVRNTEVWDFCLLYKYIAQNVNRFFGLQEIWCEAKFFCVLFTMVWYFEILLICFPYGFEQILWIISVYNRDFTQDFWFRGGSFFNLHTLLECFVPGYETLPGFLRGGMRHFGPSSSRVWNIFKISCK